MGMKVEVTGLAGCGLLTIGLVVLAFLIGPIALTYDLNHWIPVITHQPLKVPFSMWTWYIFLGGIVLSEFAVPVMVVTFILVTIGVIA